MRGFSKEVHHVPQILITTDGSAVSSKTACAGVAFAAQMQAEVLVLFVAPEYQYPIYVEIMPPSYPSEDDYRAAMLRRARKHARCGASLPATWPALPQP
jgi:nucleotide-binding universal stress UspA family protein